MKQILVVAILVVILCLAGSAAAAPTLTTSTLVTRGEAGTALTTYTVNAADGNLVANTGSVKVLFYNTSTTATCTVTIVTPQTVLGLAVADLTFTVPARKIYIAGPLPAETFNYQSGSNTGRFLMTFAGDALSKMQIAPFR